MTLLAVVIPAKDEAATIGDLLSHALRLGAELVLPVLNGCTDMTPEIVRRNSDRRVRPIHFKEPLGYDVPRIVGARAAMAAGARAVLFVDGDLSGPIYGRLLELVDPVRRGRLDLSLADCYIATEVPHRASAAREVYQARLRLNEALGRNELGAAIPSHGPSAVSRRLLERVAPAALGIPPLMQAEAVRAGLQVGLGTGLPHRELGSASRDRGHRLKIAETIVGDCLQAACFAEGRPADREGHLGYHPQRRFDLAGVEAPQRGDPHT